MSRSKAQQLQALYREIPRIDCRRKCQESCGPIPMSREERRILVRVSGQSPRTDADLTCVFLQKGLCAVYEARPMICRLWGVAEGMECPWGCVPERTLSRADAARLLRRAHEIGGEDRHRNRQLNAAVAAYMAQGGSHADQ